ncbi:patatin-like phospholipase family protein [uncultured Thiodictyon sp.]|uniref:patatin-like phospholipase family protein n=1 Tax=uncultured Thiodictyon sp. TaxID=1846217 RepID=UPI0025CF5DCA|nr:patatin-like phospholipase family protein [uncultured Thiodictyon sp.]
MRRLMILLLLCCWILPNASHGATPGPAAYPRIGLVLSGGGARGAAHVGVLKVLEELRIPISVVVGTSMGALVGGAFASGVSPAQMEQHLSSADWNHLFVDDPPRADWPIRRKEQDQQPAFDFSIGVNANKRHLPKHTVTGQAPQKPAGTFLSDLIQLPQGALAGQKVELFFSDLVNNAQGVRRFDDLSIPFRAVATDLENGDMKVFDSGALPEVMRASMSVPGVFAPVEIDNRLYVDGGLVRNLPIDVARRLGVDLVIAVNLGSPHLPRRQLNSVVGVIGQMVRLFTVQNVTRSLKTLRPGRDILISPDLGDIGAGDFARATDAIRIGVAAGRAAATRLRHLSLSPEDWAAWRTSHRLPAPDSAPITEVTVAGLNRVNPAIFKALIEHQQGRPLAPAQLDADISAIYGQGDFANINYHLDRQPGRPGEVSGNANRLIVNAREKPWGPGYLTFGAGIMTDFEGYTAVGLHGTYRRAWVNSLGAEWYTTAQLGNTADLYSEFYQPLGVAGRTFIVPSLGITSTPLSVFAGNSRIARYDVTRSTLALDWGMKLFGPNAQLRLGLALSTVITRKDTGTPVLPEATRNESGLRGRFVYDTLDNAMFSRHGNRLVFDSWAPQRAMGANQTFNRVSGSWTAAVSRGANTLSTQVMGGAAIGNPMPYYDQFALGGFLQLSGYPIEQFRANRFAFGSLVYARKIASLTPPLGRGIYLGGSLEVGTLEHTDAGWTRPGTRFGSSLFLGADTWLGPAFLALGIAGDGSTTTYIMVGRP